MKEFFGEQVLLGGDCARRLFERVKDLPIVDYHCHLNEEEIAKNAGFENIGELWLAHDHYKWRAMRLCGVDEAYITGNADFKEKFFKYAEIVPMLAGNPLYYWTHLELKEIFGINEPLDVKSAHHVWDKANETLKNLHVQDILKNFRVEYVATTDDPVSDLNYHGTYGMTRVSPTFRPDKAYTYDRAYIDLLGKSAGVQIQTLDDLLEALEKRLSYFVSKGCRISDHGFERFPNAYATREEAARIFEKGEKANTQEKDALFGFLLLWLAGRYAEKGVAMQLHFGVTRNVNAQGFAQSGPDAGYDVIAAPVDSMNVLGFLRRLDLGHAPRVVLYTLNDSLLPSLTALTGAFRGVRMGAAWWFNDTVEGIRRNLRTISEYAALGNNLGMLTDSRSFSSYSRFGFFRRILCDQVGEYVERGEYDESAALDLVEAVCYRNAKQLIS